MTLSSVLDVFRESRKEKEAKKRETAAYDAHREANRQAQETCRDLETCLKQTGTSRTDLKKVEANPEFPHASSATPPAEPSSSQSPALREP
jgi:hypothetical protein